MSAFGHDAVVAYDLRYYFDRGGQSADELLARVLDRLREPDVGATLVDVSRGTDWPQALDWVAGWLGYEGRDTGIHVEIHADDESVNLSWESVADSPGAPPCPHILGMCVLTLSGDVDEEVLQPLRTYLRVQWAAAEYDEMDGFTTV